MQASSKSKLIACYISLFNTVAIGAVLGIISFSILINFGDFLPSYISDYCLWLFFPLFIAKVLSSGLSSTVFFILTICYCIFLIFLAKYIYGKYIYGKRKKFLRIISFSMSYIAVNFFIIFLTLFIVIHLSGTLSPKAPIRVPASVEDQRNFRDIL
jgi:hypothetical protein